MTLPAVCRKSPFGPHGRKVVAFLCGWELLAIHPRSPVPTVSATVGKHPGFGVVLLVLLGHHWYLEGEQIVLDVLENLAGEETLNT